MTLEQLRVFIAVAERLHVTQASKALNMTQSAVSAAVQALEASLGTRLFDRVGRRIELTEAGRVFLPEARAVIRRAAHAGQALAELEGLRRGQIALWASQTIAGYWLPRYIARFHERHPGVALTLTIGNTAGVAKAVAAGEADLGFVEGDVDNPLFVRIPVAFDQLVLVVGAGHPWVGHPGISHSGAGHPGADWPGAGAYDLTQTRWVLREHGSGTRQMFEDALGRHGLDVASLDVALELPSNEAVLGAVTAGAGATVISRLVAAAGLRTGTLHEIALSFPERRFVALRHADRQTSRAEAAFLESLRET